MLVLVFVECSDHQLKYTQFKSEILAVQKSIKISIRWVVIIPILKCVAENQPVTPWSWKKIFPVTTMFIQKPLDCKGKIKCFSPGKCSLLVIPSSLIMFILASSAVLYLQIQKVEKIFQDESILMQYNWTVIHLFVKNRQTFYLVSTTRTFQEDTSFTFKKPKPHHLK